MIGANRSKMFWALLMFPAAAIGGLLLLMAVSASSSPEEEESPETPVEQAEEVLEDDKLLGLKHRQKLWDIEHIAFLTEQKVLPNVIRGLVEADRTAIEPLLHESFQAQWVDGETQTLLEDSLFHVTLQTASLQAPHVSADAFFAALKELREQFDENRAKIGLVRWGPEDPKRPEGPWRGVWRIRWWGQKEEGGRVEMRIRMKLALDPLSEQVGEQKHYIRSARIESLETRRGGVSMLAETTDTCGIDNEPLYDFWKLPSESFCGSSGGASVCDYDQDGHLDVLIDDQFGGCLLYRGQGDGTFKPANKEAQLPQSGMGKPGMSCWADLDNDGDPDLIVGGWIFSNDGDGTFTDVTGKCNLLARGYNGLAVADFDRDGLLDVYECHAHAASYSQEGQQPQTAAWIDGGFGYDNVLWKNLGDWKFEDVTSTAKAGGGGGSTFSAVWLDANGDNWPDVLSINEFGRNSMLLNQQDGTFRESPLDPVFGGMSMGVAAGDVNNDGQTDLFLANMYSKAGNRVISNLSRDAYPAGMYEKVFEATRGNKLFLSRGDGTFTPDRQTSMAQFGWTYGPALADFNNDGLLDLYATAGFKSEKRGKPDG